MRKLVRKEILKIFNTITKSKVIICLIAFNLLIGLATLNLPKALLVDIREAFTISVVNGSDLFVKKEIHSRGFQRENQNTIKNFFDKNHKYLLTNKYLIVKDSSTFLRARHIALSFSRYGGSGCGNYNEDFVKKIDWVSNGGGCCSDYSMVYIGLCLINNIEAREVYNIRHTFNEFWTLKGKNGYLLIRNI